jgi:hypothetical protein
LIATDWPKSAAVGTAASMARRTSIEASSFGTGVRAGAASTAAEVPLVAGTVIAVVETFGENEPAAGWSAGRSSS